MAVLAWAVLACTFVLLGFFLVRFSHFALAAGQGRYLLPASTAIGAVLVVGLNGYTNWRFQASTSIALTIIMLLYAVLIPVAYVWPKYSIPDSVPEAELASATRLDLSFEGGVQLAGVRTSDAIVIPGQGLDITTYWAAAPGAGRYADPYIHLSLVGADGRKAGHRAFWPEMDTVPAVWGDRVVANRQSFLIPHEQAADTIHIQVEVHDGRNGPTLTVRTPESPAARVTVAELLALGSVVRIRESDLPEEQRREVFADTLWLTSLDLPDKAMPGDLLPVAFYWRVLYRVSVDYTVFVHVLNQSGEIVAQLDRPPGGGTSPTSTWQVGDTLMDTYPVPLPTDLPVGTYRVRIGLYTWPDLVRAPIRVDGVDAGDMLMIGEFSITP
jgi:hypothetical protein